jgi:hypothetical protein
VIDAAIGLMDHDRCAIGFERRKQVGELPVHYRPPPQRLDVWPDRVGERTVALVEISALTVEGEPCTSRPYVADGEPDPVDDSEFRVPVEFVSKARSLARVQAIGPFVERRLVGRQTGIRRLPGPETLRNRLRIHGQRALVGAVNVGGDDAPVPVEGDVRRVLAADEIGEPVEQLRGQGLGRVDVVRVRDEREHAFQIPPGQPHAGHTLTQIRISANTATPDGRRSLRVGSATRRRSECERRGSW